MQILVNLHISFLYQALIKVYYLLLVESPFQFSLRERHWATWLFPRPGKPHIAITTPANLRGDFIIPCDLTLILSLLGSENNRKKKTINCQLLYSYIFSINNYQLIHRIAIDLLKILCETEVNGKIYISHKFNNCIRLK